MCGIVGFVGKGDQQVLKAMMGALAHRGPDDEGVYSEGFVHLGHRRLSIIDLAGGHQPMQSNDGTLAIVFNGEIYNFQKLRNELAFSYKFKTKSDTEVILAGYQKWGIGVLQKIEGMFAFALWDEEQKQLLLARDRFGEKPLYYTQQKDIFAFASELKAFAAHSAIRRETDEKSLVRYLQFGHVPSPDTIFKHINKLEPGEYAIYKNGIIDRKKYFAIQFQPEEKTSLREAEEKVEALGKEAVRKMLVADVPVGICLSGGIDSSLVAYWAQQAQSDLHTFSIGFSEKSFDESSHARAAAKIIGSRHHEKIVSAKDVLEIVPKIGEITDEPFSDASILPTYLLTQFAREHVKVALGGDGGDEVFGGYPTMLAEKYWGLINPALYAATPFVRLFRRWIPSSGGYLSFDFKLKKLMLGRGLDPVGRHQQWLGSQSSKYLSKLLGEKLETINEKKNYSGNRWENIFQYYFKSYLADQVLTKVDRASMANSLEMRAPFLDKALAEYAMRLPLKYKLRGWTTKYILRQIAQKYFPPSITRRPKQGFAVPLGQWFRKELKDFSGSALADLKQTGWFNSTAVDQLWGDHQKGKSDNRMEIWNLVALELWRKRWLL